MFDELKKQGMRSACHHAQLDVTRVNVLTTARWGLTTMEHWYGLPEALFDDRTVQDYPAAYNYNNEQDRFGQAGRLWKQAATRGSEKYESVIKELLGLDFTLDPTFTIYLASRDLMRARRADWHDEYTLPQLWDFYTPNRDNHGSFFFDWGTEDEVAWRENYRLWMAFVNDYKNRGGRVTVGSDSGFIYQLYGFGTIQELELLREAGFHPLEVLRSATLNGAQALGAADRIGSIEPGKLADLAVARREPAGESQGAVRHRPHPSRRRRQGASRRRREVHDQGRHRLRREASARRRAHDGGGREAQARNHAARAALRLGAGRAIEGKLSSAAIAAPLSFTRFFLPAPDTRTPRVASRWRSRRTPACGSPRACAASRMRRRRSVGCRRQRRCAR